MKPLLSLWFTEGSQKQVQGVKELAGSDTTISDWIQPASISDKSPEASPVWKLARRDPEGRSSAGLERWVEGDGLLLCCTLGC